MAVDRLYWSPDSANLVVRMALHELGVALLRGQRGSTQAENGSGLTAGGADQQIRYKFDGEFWTDELDDLVVQMEDRCIE